MLSSDLRDQYSEVSRQAHEEHKLVIFTVIGHGDAVILVLQDYYLVRSEPELLRNLALAQEDVINGRIVLMQSIV